MASIKDFIQFELVVAQIKEVKEHENADRLYVMQVDLGEEENRQIVAGIRSSYSIEELIDKKIVVIKNLDPAVLRGEKSEGMLLAASGENGSVLLAPEADIPVGSKIK